MPLEFQKTDFGLCYNKYMMTTLIMLPMITTMIVTEIDWNLPDLLVFCEKNLPVQRQWSTFKKKIKIQKVKKNRVKVEMAAQDLHDMV